jgi:SAM-dependent methyltransferase
VSTDPPHHWFEAIADHVGPAYLRYSFTKGTDNEVAFLVDVLGLAPGMRVLDVGCGPGRHAHALGARGIEVVGVDISATFIDLARAIPTPGVTFQRADARHLAFEGEFDAVISLCQGAFGLTGGPADGPSPPGAAPVAAAELDAAILSGMATARRAGGRVVLSAFSAYFQVRFLEDADSFDAATGVNHELSNVANSQGDAVDRDLWTTCYTPRELRLLAGSIGLTVDDIWSVTPGSYERRPPDLDHPEFLLVAH